MCNIPRENFLRKIFKNLLKPSLIFWNIDVQRMQRSVCLKIVTILTITLFLIFLLFRINFYITNKLFDDLFFKLNTVFWSWKQCVCALKQRVWHIKQNYKQIIYQHVTCNFALKCKIKCQKVMVTHSIL